MPTTGEYSLPDDTSYRMNVVELEVPPCLTTLTVRTHEGALPLVSLPYRTPNVRWNVPPPHAGSGSARPGRGTELLSLQLKDQGFKGPIEHLRNIPAHHDMTEQSLRVSQLLVGLLVDRHPEAVALHHWRGRSNARGSSNWPRGQFTVACVTSTPREGSHDWPRGQFRLGAVRGGLRCLGLWVQPKPGTHSRVASNWPRGQ